jgi:hypothetical protein
VPYPATAAAPAVAVAVGWAAARSEAGSAGLVALMMALCSPSATWWVKLTETCSNPAAVHLSEDGGLVDRQVDDAVGAVRQLTARLRFHKLRFR